MAFFDGIISLLIKREKVSEEEMGERHSNLK